jgi:hypothetical protein
MPMVEGITRAEVRSRTAGLGSITDSARIAALVTFVNQQRSGWSAPALGVPVGQVGVTLYREERVVESIFCGPGFLELRRGGQFYSKSAGPDAIVRFRELLAPYPVGCT